MIPDQIPQIHRIKNTRNGKHLGKCKSWYKYFFSLFLVSFQNIRLYRAIITILFIGLVMYSDIVYITIVGQKKEKKMELCCGQVPIFYQN